MLWNFAQTLWRVVPMVGAVGLDYPSVYLVAGSLEVEMTPVNLQKLQALEREALTVMREDKDDGHET